MACTFTPLPGSFPLAHFIKSVLMVSAASLVTRSLACALLSTLVGCNAFPRSGPLAGAIEEAERSVVVPGIQIVDVDPAVTRRLISNRIAPLFSERMPDVESSALKVGRGDVLEISVTEAPPAILFGASGGFETRSAPMTSRMTSLPDQMVSDDGTIVMPFVGRIEVSGKSLSEVEQLMQQRLGGIANKPQVLVRMTRNNSSNVTVVGEVGQSIRMPLTPTRERLLDALAAAGGTRQPINRMTLQVTRGQQVASMPLEAVIRDPLQNIVLQPGDVVTAMFQPLSFTAMGATGKNEEINFEAKGISLAQALARAGGIQDSRANARGVFIFRFEPATALDWPTSPPVTTPDGQVPVVYRIDLLDPASFFVAQSFPINDRDLIYVSNAPITEVQKFLNVIFSITYPVLNYVTITQ
jgi:polysaccharide biosynthesis/export protein